MKKNWLKILVFILILAFYASFIFIKIQLTYMDNDAGLYISDGKLIWQEKSLFKANPYSYVETSYPVVNHHWLASLIFYLVSEIAGFKGLTILKAIVLLSAFSLLFRVAIKKADFWLVAVLSLPAILILSQRTRIRPEMFSYLFIASFLYFLTYLEENPRSKKIFWLIPLQFLWVNFHIYFFIGIALVGGLLFEKIVIKLADDKNSSDGLLIKRLFLILFILIAVCFLNPNGLDGALSPLKTHSYASFSVSENQPLFNLKASILSWNLTGSAFIPMVFIFLFSLIVGFKQSNILLVFAGLATMAAGLIYLRLVTLFALIFLLAASANLNVAFLKIREYFKSKWPRLTAILAYILILIITLSFPYVAYSQNAKSAAQGFITNRGVGLDCCSNDAAEFFKENKLKGPIFNDYDIGGYILYHLYPEEKVFVDNNGADSYPVSFFDDIFVPALINEEKWREIDGKYDLNTIFISLRDGSPAVGSFLWSRLHDPLWALVYADTYAIILVKNNEENNDIIKKFRIDEINAKDKISRLLESKDVVEKTVGSRLLYLIGREDLSTSALKKVVAKYPKNGWIWLYMGSIKVLKNDPASVISAVIFLENAVKMGERSGESYTWLGLSYFKSSQFKKAEEAFQKALWYEPGRYDTINYLNQLQTYLSNGSEEKGQ